MKIFRKARKKVRNFLFIARSRPLVRDRDSKAGLIFQEGVLKTPEVSGKSLVMKREHYDPERERRVRKLVMGHHENIEPENYTLRLSKRMKPMRGMRVEEYYDRPTLGELLDMEDSEAAREFRKRHGLGAKRAQEIAERVNAEIRQNIWQIKSEKTMDEDIHSHQFIVDSHKDGKLDLIMIDS